jgi:hypothetical protein
MTRTFGLPPSLIGEIHSDAGVESKLRHRVQIAVINSARERLAKVLEGWHQHRLHKLLSVISVIELAASSTRESSTEEGLVARI